MSSRNWLFGLILIVATTLAYQPAWNGKPIWDDEIHITIPALRSVHGLARIWTDPAAAPQYYPLLHTVFWIEYRLWGAWPLPYHLVNIALHALTAVLMLRILQRLGLPGAWVAAAISRCIRCSLSPSPGFRNSKTLYPERYAQARR